ncbi:MAG: SDR family NAD(P)-dependent oxidoreductase, partial [Alphaproteobacteria bacterium]|nr:SDR family NAD(P)-dependent oxidoreductase [Alphaproteobacteria bacterium]
MPRATPRFAGRNGLVTGAASGLGREVARGLAAEGARLVLFDRDAAGLDMKTRALICIVSDTAIHAWPELAVHMRMARRMGWSEDELIEALMHMNGY